MERGTVAMSVDILHLAAEEETLPVIDNVGKIRKLGELRAILADENADEAIKNLAGADLMELPLISRMDLYRIMDNCNGTVSDLARRNFYDSFWP